MSERPKALQMAEWLEQTFPTSVDVPNVATELRRLYAVNAELVEALRCISLSAQNYRSTRKSIRLYAQAAIAAIDAVPKESKS